MRKISLSNLVTRVTALAAQLPQSLSSLYSQQPAPINFNPTTNTFRYRWSRLRLPANTNQSKVVKTIWSEPNKIWNNDELVATLFHDISYTDTEVYHKKVYDAIRLVNRKAQQKLQAEVVISRGRAWQANTEHPSHLFSHR